MGDPGESRGPHETAAGAPAVSELIRLACVPELERSSGLLAPVPEVVEGLEPARYVGEEHPGERILVCSIHDGDAVPAELLDGEPGLLERPEVRRAYHRERDWGANLVARHLARNLGLGGFVGVDLARVMLDFGRFPGCSRPGDAHLLRKSIFPPLQGLLSPEARHALLTRYYDHISREMTRRIGDKTLIIAVHTYDSVGRRPAFRPEVGLVTGAVESHLHPTGPEPGAGRAYGDRYDPLFPIELCAAACDPLLSSRMAFDLERGGLLLSMNTPYAMPEGCPEIRVQVYSFFRYLRRRYEEACPETGGRIAHRRVWDMLLDVTGRSADALALRACLHRARRPTPGLEAFFDGARRAYRAIARFLAESRAELLRDYRFSRGRPSSLAIEIRKDLVCDFDAEGNAVGLRPDAERTARDLARQLAVPIASYLRAVFPTRKAAPAGLVPAGGRTAA